MTDIDLITSMTRASAVARHDADGGRTRFDFISGRPRPTWRGRIHAIAAPLAAIATAVLASLTSGVMIIATFVYGISMVACFGVSASYHLWTQTIRTQRRMQRIDHAMISVFIAGTATPIYMTVPLGRLSIVLLVLTWAGAVVGAGLKLGRRAWRTASAMYLVTGWTALAALPGLWTFAGPLPAMLILTGGVVYTVGAVIFWRKWCPITSHRWGHHEMFHVCTVIGAGLHFTSVATIVTR